MDLLIRVHFQLTPNHFFDWEGHRAPQSEEALREEMVHRSMCLWCDYNLSPGVQQRRGHRNGSNRSFLMGRRN